MNRHHGPPERERGYEGPRTESQSTDRGGRGDPRGMGQRDGNGSGYRPHFEYGDRETNSEPYFGDAPPWSDPRNPDYGSSQQPFGSQGARGGNVSNMGSNTGYDGRSGSMNHRDSGGRGQNWGSSGSVPQWNSPGYGDFTPFQGLTSDRRTHKGKAPKGYKRTDDRIRDDVCDRLTEHDVDVSDVEVRVANGEVTLTGTVADRDSKFHAERIAESVSGVTDVQNQIKIKRNAAPTSEHAATPTGSTGAKPDTSDRKSAATSSH